LSTPLTVGYTSAISLRSPPTITTVSPDSGRRSAATSRNSVSTSTHIEIACSTGGGGGAGAGGGITAQARPAASTTAGSAARSSFSRLAITIWFNIEWIAASSWGGESRNASELASINELYAPTALPNRVGAAAPGSSGSISSTTRKRPDSSSVRRLACRCA